MRVKCLECGFEDEGKFCSNCGAPLHKTDSPVKQEPYKIPEEGSWLDKCPVCQSGKLSLAIKKKLFGLVSTEKVECDGCNAVFTQIGGKYKLEYVSDVSNAIWQDYGNQILDYKEWKNIAYGGVSDGKQKEMDLESWMTQIREGNIILHMSSESPIILKKNEDLLLSFPNISLSEPRAVRTGAYGGPSFRVAKGVSLRVGGFRAQSHEEIKNIDSGTLTLTNKRIVFSGTKRNTNIPLRKIISLEPYNDAIAIRREGKGKTEYYTGINQATLTITTDDRQCQEPFSGLIFMYLVEGLTKIE